MSNYKNYRDYILDKLDERTLLEQLAEEASELSQAALKLIRAKRLDMCHAKRHKLCYQRQGINYVAKHGK